jgi:hypothetical protein
VIGDFGVDSVEFVVVVDENAFVVVLGAALDVDVSFALALPASDNSSWTLDPVTLVVVVVVVVAAADNSSWTLDPVTLVVVVVVVAAAAA